MECGSPQGRHHARSTGPSLECGFAAGEQTQDMTAVVKVWNYKHEFT